MRYAWVLLIGWLAVVGCQKNQMNFDPFSMSGPTLMPPPGTGSAGRPDPYYRPSSPTPVPGTTGANGTPLPAQYARFTSEDGANTNVVADSRASYTAPLPNAPQAAPGVAPGWTSGQPTMPYSNGAAYTPPNPAAAVSPGSITPNVSQQANPLAPNLPSSSPAVGPASNWSGRY